MSTGATTHMWPDNETETDFVNFSGVADTVAEIIVQANRRPISIGISGSWGTGKSSLIRLTQASLTKRGDRADHSKFVFVQFNAWLYQGYDDARAALMDVIANELKAQATLLDRGLEKAGELLRRVRWLRVAKFAGSVAATFATGGAPLHLLPGLLGVGSHAKEEAPGEHSDTAWLKPKEESPPKEIQALRDTFEETLQELDVTLVVLIDDLDRCLPETTISTLEAIRLFLFMKNTAFVIAADTEVIKHAVRKHFEGVPDDLMVTSYFDKLIQVPIRVPPLGTQEVRAYMMMLYVEDADLAETIKEAVREGVVAQLRKTWQGKRVDAGYVRGLILDCPSDLAGRLDVAERLAPMMTSAPGVLGNPRLIKRFLNALAIRMAISTAQGVGVDEAVLAKLLLFERSGNPKAFDELISHISRADNGKPAFLAEWEEQASIGKELTVTPNWDGKFEREWLSLPPRLADIDLRGALYVSREHSPLITPEDRLSSGAAELLTALIEHPTSSSNFVSKLTELPKNEIAILMDRLLDRARREQEWGVPDILDACLTLSQVDPIQGLRLEAFLRQRPVAQIKPNIIPKIRDQQWALDLFEHWSTCDVHPSVKRAISARLR
jgi:predicted KAP-like P-loop ATPase